MTRPRRSCFGSVYASLLASGLFVTSCAHELDDESATIEGHSEAILNGTQINEANSGIANVDGCTGTLLRNNWVLTAFHCVRLHLDREYPNSVMGWVFDGDSVSEAAYGAQVDASGRLVLGGFRYASSTSSSKRLFLRRYTAAGTLDTSFGTGGTVVTDVAYSSNESIEDVATLSDGRVVAAGYSLVSSRPTLTVVRYSSRGTLDTTFNSTGRVQTTFPSSVESWAYGVRIDGSGRVLVAGRVRPSSAPTTAQFALARYTSAGRLDTTFNTTGLVTTSFASDSLSSVEAKDLTVDGSGRIVLTGVGQRADGTKVAVLARYTSSGALDASFGGDGRVVLANGSAANSVIVQGTRLLVGGEEGGHAAVYRLNDNGTLDTTFGVGGVARPRWYVEDSSAVAALALTSDGRIRVGATASAPWKGGKQVAYASLGGNGELNFDRVYPTVNGSIENYLAGQTLATAMAVSGARVFVVGVNGFDNSPYETAAFVVMQPDRLSDTTFTGNEVPVRMGNQQFFADQAHVPPGSDDVALLHTPSGFTMNGSTTSYRFPGFFTGPYDSLVGTDAIIKGYGNSVIDANGNESGAGYLREGRGRVTSVDTRYAYLGYRPSPAVAQIGLVGDSGSGAFTLDGKIFGVLSIGTETTAYYVRTDRFASWATGLIGP